MNDELHKVVGIDLGTTYSAVAAYNSDEFNPEIIEDGELEGTAAAAAPSVVRLDTSSGRTIIGHEAKNAIEDKSVAGETIIEVKREMGAMFDADSLERFGAGGDFAEDDPVRVRLGRQWYRPQEISALVLMHMKRIAERRLESEIHDAVVTVPAYFTERQKKATEEAALLAGLYPRQLIPEPTAAAIAYGVDRADVDRQIYLVFDLGGGTFDVSIIETRDNQIEVIATAGDQRLGGGDFDDAIVRWICEKLDREPADDAEHLRLKAVAETAKRALSLRGETVIDLGDGTAPLPLDRAGFELLIKPILDRSLEQVEEALRFADDAKGVQREDVNAVLLVGGSTRIPSIRQMLLDHFDQEDEFVRGDANPDTLVARGAAIVAHRFEPTAAFDLATRPTAEREVEDEDDTFDITLITEHTLGVGVQDGRFDPLIPRGAKIPAKQSKHYTNPPLAEHIEATIYQGEQEYIYDNTLVGTIHLDDIEPRPEGYHQFKVDFSLDVNGLLGVQVVHVNTGREFQATFEQSTQIGKLDDLAERREVLLDLFASKPVPLDAAVPPTATVPPPASVPAPVGVPAPVTVPAPVDAAAAPVDPAEAPPEYRRLVKKAQRLASDGDAPAPLHDALASFWAAVRSGAGDDALEAVADRLEDALDDLRA